MTWKIDNQVSKQVKITGMLDVTYDGSNVIVLTSDVIYFYQLRDTYIPDNENFLEPINASFKLINTIDVTSIPAIDIIFHDNSLYCKSSVKNFNTIHKISNIYSTTPIFEVITLPETMNSNLGSINGNLWMSSVSTGTGTQNLYKFNTKSGIFTSSIIPSARQNELRFIAGDFKGNILVTSFNNSAISKHSDIDGSFISNIGVSPGPYFIKTMEDRTVYVGSNVAIQEPDPTTYIQWEGKEVDPEVSEFKSSIITEINTTTDTALNRYSIQGELSGLIDYGNSLWYTADGEFTSNIDFETVAPTNPPTVPTPVGPAKKKGFKHLGRLNLIDSQIYRTKAFTFIPTPPPDDLTANNVDIPLDWNIDDTSNKFLKSFKLNANTYEYWDGVSIQTKTIPDFLLTMTEDGLLSFRLGKLYNLRDTFIHSTAMISKTIYDLTGDL